MTQLTAAVIKTKFPEFADQDDTFIEFSIEEAQRNVDDTWLAKDKMLALTYMACHYLAIAVNRANAVNTQMVQSESIGEISVTYAHVQEPTIKDPSDLTTTPYGVRYLELVKLNFPAVMVI